ncbi:MAG: ATP-binding protein [Deltaproteobacteria bacterium]|nr:ATP-binding protein [Deltaproteobacteria bacterium]
MLGRDFKRWAAHGVRNYGSDRWHFLRELVQNARDAGAAAIQVRAARQGEREVIACEDDGTGMSLDHARCYLFRLYASSKNGGERYAGEFGIGFWTVLHFGFERLRLESRTPREAWAVELDRELAAKAVPCALAHRGTRITLARPAACVGEQELRASVRAALTRYCRCLHPLDRPDRLLPVAVDGVPLEQELRLDSPLQLRFRDGPVEGAVGLAPRPRVDLYARGLPVWSGLTIDELSHSGAPGRYRVELARGLAPVFLLNGRGLRVDATRTAVIDDGRLARVRRAARRALERLVRRHVQQQFPRSWSGRLLDRGRDALASLARRRWWYLAAGAATLAAILVWLLLPRPRLAEPAPPASPAGRELTADPVDRRRPPASARAPAAPPALPTRYLGAQVDAPVDADFELRYRPPQALWLRALVAERYDRERGFVAADRPPPRDAPGFVCRRACVDVAFRTSAAGSVLLPLPEGYEVERGSVRFDGAPIARLQIGAAHERLALGPSGVGTVEYRIGPRPRPPRLGEAERRSLLELPADLGWPAELEAEVRRGRPLGVGERIELAARLTVGRLTFDSSESTAARFRGAAPGSCWLQTALAAAGGDCDVINGLNTLLLRALGVPARLAVGLVGRDGAASGALHAWTEYFDRGWRQVDLSRRVVAVSGPPERPAIAPPIMSPMAPPMAPPIAPSIARPTSPPTADTRATPESTSSSGQRETVVDKGRGRAAASKRRARPAALVAGVAVAALGLWLAIRRLRRNDRFDRHADDGAAQQILVEMLLNALAQPDAWRSARPIWSHPLLPLIGGGRMAVGRALRLARRHRLFAGRAGSPLTDLAVAAGNPILDLGQPLFAPAISSVCGVVDLGRFEPLRPLDPVRAVAPGSRELLAEVSALLRQSGAGEVALLPCDSSQARTFFDVDLRQLRLPGHGAWPRRYIAVACQSPYFLACVEQRATRPTLARFRLAHAALRSSLFFVERQEQLLRRAALQTLREASA